MRKIILFIVPILLLAALPADIVQAQTGNFVPCNGADCSACDFVSMVNAIIKWLFGIVFILFAVLMAKAGFGLVTSAGSQSALEAAKSSFQNAIIGLIIVMAGWLMVDTIMRSLLDGDQDGIADGNVVGYGPWSQVECQKQISPQGGDKLELPSAGGTPPDPNVTAACTDDNALMAKYKGSPVGVEDPRLRTMINCYLSDSAIDAATDKSQLYTIDLTNPRCSLTNGNTVCGPCSHSNNSMHYGRGSGTGAKAVDFNARGQNLLAEQKLHQLLLAKKAQCGGTFNFENNHTHISL